MRLRNLTTISLLRVLVAATILGPSLVLVGVGWRTRDAAFDRARGELVRTSEVAREHATRVFESFELVAKYSAELLSEAGSPLTPEAERRLHDRFAAMIGGLPQVEALAAIGADGRMQVGTGRYPVDRTTDYSDRDYFSWLADHPDAPFYVSHVEISRLTGKPFFGWTTARRGHDRQFLGVVNIAISPNFFLDFYNSIMGELAGSPGGRALTMIRADGQFLAHYPETPNGFIKVPSDNPFFAAIKRNPEKGVYFNRSVIAPGAPRRLFAFRKVSGYPIYVVAGRSVDAIQGEWLRSMWPFVLGDVVATLLLAGVALIALGRAKRERQALAQLASEMERREAAEEQLRQSQKMEAVGQLTGGIAHDFNNILMVVRSSVDMLRKPDLAEDRRRRYLDAISTTTDRAIALTSQLLAFARRQTLNAEAFPVERSLARVLEMVASVAGPNVRIDVQVSKSPLHVMADANHFDTCIVNLALNARDAMPGGGTLTVGARSVGEIPAMRGRPAVRGAYVAVSVSDTGEGIAPESLGRIFEPFYTTKPPGRGTGLGLSQVQGFARQSGGDVAVESEVGKGTTFTVYLPRAEEPEKPAQIPRALVSASEPLQARVLVVEDNPEIQAFVGEGLESLGCEVILASSGEKALQLLAAYSGRFDVVFSDVVMPGMSGLELAQEIRRQYADLPVVLTTGYSQALVENGLEGVELLRKPYRFEDLLERFRRVLGDAKRPN